jgi:hypothetical protein
MIDHRPRIALVVMMEDLQGTHPENRSMDETPIGLSARQSLFDGYGASGSLTIEKVNKMPIDDRRGGEACKTSLIGETSPHRLAALLAAYEESPSRARDRLSRIKRRPKGIEFPRQEQGPPVHPALFLETFY